MNAKYHVFLDVVETYGTGLRIAVQLGWTYVGMSDNRKASNFFKGAWPTHLLSKIPAQFSAEQVSIATIVLLFIFSNIVSRYFFFCIDSV